MRKERFTALLLLIMALLYASALCAHTVNFEVQQKGLAVRIFYGADDPSSYSEYEVFGPGDKLPHQTGRTDRNGFVSFVPDRQGVWKIKVLGESSHGFHGVTTEIKVDRDLNLESFKKPLAATSTKLVTGISLIIGIFGIYALISSRKRKKKETS
jgi:nickel transport protein